jgi:hypothetical protein
MTENPLVKLPFRTESDFLRLNKDKVATIPWKVKSELQHLNPIVLSPEHRHYELLKTHFDRLCEWVEKQLHLEVTPAQKADILRKIYLVDPKKFREYTEKKADHGLRYATAFIDGLTKEMVVQDLEQESVPTLVWNFSHELVHVLSAARYVAHLKTRGHRRYFSEDHNTLGLARLNSGGEHFFLTMNEGVTEMMSFESLDGFFQNNNLLESDSYACLMLFIDLLTNNLADRSNNTQNADAYRKLLYRDMLTGSEDFFKIIRQEYGGKFVSQVATLKMNNAEKLFETLLALCKKIDPFLANDFDRKISDFTRGDSIKIMQNFSIKTQHKTLEVVD